MIEQGKPKSAYVYDWNLSGLIAWTAAITKCVPTVGAFFLLWFLLLFLFFNIRSNHPLLRKW